MHPSFVVIININFGLITKKYILISDYMGKSYLIDNKETNLIS